MAAKSRILFVCTGNSARSQMAEGLTRYYGGDDVVVDSAGTAPKGVHPYAKWAMNQIGCDIEHQTSDALESKTLSDFDLVITLCGDARDRCPPVPDSVRHEHWDLPDPAAMRGKPADQIKAFCTVRNDIEKRVKKLLTEIFED